MPALSVPLQGGRRSESLYRAARTALNPEYNRPPGTKTGRQQPDTDRHRRRSGRRCWFDPV